MFRVNRVGQSNGLILGAMASVGCGVAFAAAGIAHAGGATLPWVWIAAACFFASTAAALAKVAICHRRDLALVCELREHQAALRPADLPAPKASVTQAIRELMKTSERAIADANLKAREQNIQLKVAQAERQSAEAIIHTREKDLSEMKNDFVSMVSHELRTPLASIKAYVEMLIDGEAEDQKTQHEFYEVIQNEANRLGRLIDNILSISRIESGLVRVNRRPQSLSQIVRDAVEVIAPQAAQKQITLTQTPAPSLYQTLADRDMLHQAVLNLLSNAVKFTPAGGSIIAETSIDPAQKKVLTRIIDTGVGIPPKDLPYVFDKFYRAESNSRMAPGTGLGLSLVRHIVETVHHGKMFVESRVGKGSCFGFELELAR